MIKNKLFKFIGSISLISIGISGVIYWHNSHSEKNYNVLLVTIDALRSDHMGCYGYEKETSPNIDKLAKEGVIFTQAISQGAETIPSFPSLMTSLYPHQHGDLCMLSTPVTSYPTLAEILKENGYYTAAIVDHFLSPHDMNRGFIEFAELYDAAGKDNNAFTLTQKAIRWLNENKNRKFFLWLHYFDTHGPYLPPSPYSELFLPGKFKEKGKKFIREKYQWVGVFPKQCLDNSLTPEDREYYISQYDGEIRFTDEQIGFLLKELKRLKLDKKTLVILTADHGENLADYGGRFDHGESLYDVLIKVPLIIKNNNLFKNKKIDSQIQMIDIMPTILDFLNIETNTMMEGESLLPLLSRWRKKQHSRFAYSEVWTEGYVLKSIRTKDWKLIYNLSFDKYELYNLKKDPYELNNLAEANEKELDFLKSKLECWMESIKEDNLLTNELPEDVKEKLKSLGYVR